jgi:hypothetical protein
MAQLYNTQATKMKEGNFLKSSVVGGVKEDSELQSLCIIFYLTILCKDNGILFHSILTVGDLHQLRFEYF